MKWYQYIILLPVALLFMRTPSQVWWLLLLVVVVVVMLAESYPSLLVNLYFSLCMVSYTFFITSLIVCLCSFVALLTDRFLWTLSHQKTPQIHILNFVILEKGILNPPILWGWLDVNSVATTLVLREPNAQALVPIPNAITLVHHVARNG
jgi:hypothetical protein